MGNNLNVHEEKTGLIHCDVILTTEYYLEKNELLIHIIWVNLRNMDFEK